MASEDRATIGDRLLNGLFVGLQFCLRRLPYRQRISLSGWFASHVLGPLSGVNRRVRENLLLIDPTIEAREIRAITKAVLNNFGRSLAELYSGQEFVEHVQDTPIEGPGLAHLDQAHAAGRPVVLAASHFGNYDAWRSALFRRGFRVGAIYRPMNNKAFNSHYVEAMKRIGEPLFARDTELRQMLRFLRSGGMVAFGFDQAAHQGETLTFFGQPALTPTSAAELALKLDVDLIPIYAIRQPDGVSFRVIAEAPIPHSNAIDMTQALNDQLEAVVRENMGQWLWLHRRWK